jgi:4-alpha-glucanotransferase
MTDRLLSGRHAGILVPLFSIPSTSSWGIGEIPDLVPLARWVAACGGDFIQMLPVNAMADESNSPYSATSAMAFDPIYIALEQLEDLGASGEGARLEERDRAVLDEVRQAARVEYGLVRRLKQRALARAFERFSRVEQPARTARAEAFAAYCEDQAWWLDDFALFCAVRHELHGAPWWQWPAALRDRDAEALAAARRTLADRVAFARYTQWLAESQWHEARAQLGGVCLVGDLPFMVAADSADVWTLQHAFRLDATVGVPPDAFSPTGQDWGLPVYRWDVLAADDYPWIRQRAGRMARLFDGYRVDHLVGLYRTYVIPRDGSPHYFVPPDEDAQTAQGERLLHIYGAPGVRVIAEDLGTVPDFVRASMDRLGAVGYKVFRWERDWHAHGHPFLDPAVYPPHSVATTGTHDTETLVAWWDAAGRDERLAVLALPALAGRGFSAAGACTPELADALLELLAHARSDFLILPIQDVFGWRARVNTPGTVGADNWSFRLPGPVDVLFEGDRARERAATLRAWMQSAGRTTD